MAPIDNFVIPTGAQRSGEPALSLPKGTCCRLQLLRNLRFFMPRTSESGR